VSTTLPPPRQRRPDARFRHLARQIQRRGERPLYEFLREIAAGRDPIALMETYAALPTEIIRALGADKLRGPAVICLEADDDV
jgi:hypothetical protein